MDVALLLAPRVRSRVARLYCSVQDYVCVCVYSSGLTAPLGAGPPAQQHTVASGQVLKEVLYARRSGGFGIARCGPGSRQP